MTVLDKISVSLRKNKEQTIRNENAVVLEMGRAKNEVKHVREYSTICNIE